MLKNGHYFSRSIIPLVLHTLQFLFNIYICIYCGQKESQWTFILVSFFFLLKWQIARFAHELRLLFLAGLWALCILQWLLYVISVVHSVFDHFSWYATFICNILHLRMFFFSRRRSLICLVIKYKSEIISFVVVLCKCQLGSLDKKPWM